MTKDDLRETARTRRLIRREVTGLEEILTALTPFDFHDRRRLIRWTCEWYGIDPTRLGNA